MGDRLTDSRRMRLVFCTSILVVLAIVAPVSPLTCWDCLDGCEDPLNHKQEECREEEKHCLKIKLQGQITLSCSPDPPTQGQMGCTKKGGELERCYWRKPFATKDRERGEGGLYWA